MTTTDPAVTTWQATLADVMTAKDAEGWLRFIEVDIRPGYIPYLAAKLNCPATVPSVIETLKLIVEAGR